MEHLHDFLKHTRIQYDKGILAENHLQANPIDQFATWMQEAINAGVPEPNAMDLSTVHEGRPSSRIVLLKGVDERGFIFYTNYDSRKGREIGASPFACLNFFWQQQSRQVRVEGTLEKTSPEESDLYFSTRPRDSQIGAWASSQSAVVPNRETIENEFARYAQLYEEVNIPRPPHWGGFVLKPERIEFWQGRPNRLHDRFLYEPGPTGWMVFRLSP